MTRILFWCCLVTVLATAASSCSGKPRCGNGIIDPGEQCDDGNRVGADGCELDCHVTPALCGNAKVEKGESCDDGNRVDGDGCENTCVPTPVCGNMAVERFEACDDGNTVNGDGCEANCTLTPAICGNKVQEGDEECDDGNRVNGDGCENNCRVSADNECPNGTVEAPEECDDNNSTDGDGCEADCTVTLNFCGNHIPETGEACDDGNKVSGDGCENDCTATVMNAACGNGKRENAEACDDGNQDDGDGCQKDCTLTTTGAIRGCPGMNLAAPATGTCTATTGDAAVLMTGVVLADGVTYLGGQVLVDTTGKLSCVGCDCAGAAGAATASTLVCPQAVISPGLINAHDHISFQASPYVGTTERYEHRHDWRVPNNGHTKVNNGGNATNQQVRWAELRQVMAGTTSIVGATYTLNGNGGLLRNLDSNAGQLGLNFGSAGVVSDTFPLGDATSGLELTSTCAYPKVTTASAIPNGSAYVPHISEGIEQSAHNEFVCLSQANGVGVLSDRTAIVHGIAMTPADIRLMAQTRTSLVWSPRSNISLYGDTANIALYRRLGVNIALGTDWTISGSMNLLRELKCADSLNSTRYATALTDEELWHAVTAGGADATATQTKIGRLQQGLVADIAIFKRKGTMLHRSVIEADPQDVVLTMRAGKVLYGDKNIVDAFDATAQCESIDVCGTMKSACVKSELVALMSGNAANSLALLQQANASTYPLFFCGAVTKEPTCIPERATGNSRSSSTVYAAPFSAMDPDGDGVPTPQDNCPNVFNPVRPMDSGNQANADGDAFGDACDVCPFDANTMMCSVPNPNDRDGDGVANGLDNCPVDANVDQADSDTDLKGDVCDLCPSIANPGDQACPVSIYDIKKGVVPVGSRVALENVLVTGAGPSGFFVQVHESDTGYLGREYSGLFAFKTNNGVSAGDRITISAVDVTNFNGQIQLTNVPAVVDAGTAGITIVSSANAMPAPVVIDPAQVASNDGGVGGMLDGVLVTVANASVTSVTPPLGAGDKAPNKEFVINGSLRVNDYLYLVTPFPVVGQQFASVTGVLELRNGDYKIEPRSANDFATGPAVLVGFDPATVFIREGSTTTIPKPLTIRTSNTETTDQSITLVAGTADISVPSSVTMTAGQTSVVVPVTGVTASMTPVTLTASKGSSMQEVSVRVLGATESGALTALEPGTLTASVGSTVTFSVNFDLPVASATSVTIALSPTTLGTAPATVMVAADQTSATFDVVVSATAATGTVQATAGSVMVTANLQVIEASTDHVVISEFSPRGPGGGFDEFIELYNPSGVAVDLDGWKFQSKQAAGGAWIERLVIPPNTVIAPHRYLLIANSGGYGASSGPTPDLTWNTTSAGIADSGNVRIVRTVGQNLEVVDALGYGSTADSAEGSPTGSHPGTSSASASFERKAKASSTPASMATGGADVNAGNAEDTDKNSADFVLRTTRDPQSGASGATEP